MTILVVGDANADLSATLGRFPAEGHDSSIESLGWGSGGAAVNVAAALALLGAPTRLLARVGRDPAATVALRAAQSGGVDLSDVQVDERLATGLCFAAISPGGERTFFSFRGANVAMGLPEGRDALAGVRWLHICGHALLEGAQRETGLSLIDAAYQRGLPVSLDLCLPLISARRAEVLDLLPSIATLFVNELEYAALLGGALPPEGVLLVVKLGARGCALGRELRPVPGYAVRALDTTACGDAFAAGFVHAHLRGATPPACAALGNALGALVATRPGAADSLPGREELLAFLTERAPELSRLVG